MSVKLIIKKKAPEGLAHTRPPEEWGPTTPEAALLCREQGLPDDPELVVHASLYVREIQRMDARVFGQPDPFPGTPVEIVAGMIRTISRLTELLCSSNAAHVEFNKFKAAVVAHFGLKIGKHQGV